MREPVGHAEKRKERNAAASLSISSLIDVFMKIKPVASCLRAFP